MTNWYNFPNQIYLAPLIKGVYLLGDHSGVVYVGRADSIQDRLKQHPDPNNPCLQRKLIKYFAYEETNYPENRELQLINRFDPECNRE